MVAFILLFFITLFSITAQGSLYIDCQASEKSCNSYLCLEGIKHCGIKGYYLKFRYRYCETFSKYNYKFTSKGKRWLSDVKVCLQENAISDIEIERSCKQIKKSAFSGHVACYLDAGFCNLSFKDKVLVMKIVNASMLKPRIAFPGLKMLTKCLKR